MKQFTHYNADGALVLDFTGDRRWLVEPKGEELHLTPLAGPVAAAGLAPAGVEQRDPNARPIVLKFDKPGSLTAIAVGSDKVRNNIEGAAKIKAQYDADHAAVTQAIEQAEALKKAFAAKYGK